MARLGAFAVRRCKAVLAVAAVLVVLFGAVGGGVADVLSSGGFEDPDAPSTAASRVLREEFAGGGPNLLLLVTARQGSVDDAAVAEAGRRVADELAAVEGVEQAASYWHLGSPPPLRSRDGRQALVLARLGGDEDEVRETVERVSPAFTRSDDLVTVAVSGQAEVFRQVGTTIERDLARAEGVAIPITLGLLVLVFGSLVAAGLPLAVGIVSVLGTFFVLRVLAEITQVSIFSINLATAMGLGLAIDYSLFVVSRYREELQAGAEPGDAVVRTVATAGRTVAFSAATVAVSLAALLVFPLAFLRSFAYAGIPVVALAAVGATVVLPAALAALGHRIDRLAFRRRRPAPVGEGFWHAVALFVMRRPVPIAVSVVALLLVLGAPFLGVRFGLPDDRVLPASASSRVVLDQLRRNFDSNEAFTLAVVADGIGDPVARSGDIDAYAAALSTVEGVVRVDALTGSYMGGSLVLGATPASERFRGGDATWFSVVQGVEPTSTEGEGMVRAVRALPAPFPVAVAGNSAQLVDAKQALFSRLPLAAGLIALVTFTLLFLMFGSLLVPLKALVLNLLSLTATFGAMVWIFQDGHLSGLLDFTATGSVDTTTPILMFCIAFGLSMDYEVFLLSRIKEAYDRTGDNEASVALGLERTGRIVTAAAGLLAVVFLAMATSQVTFIKLFGIGLTMAVLMDATLIRAALVPAFMRLAGRANWWAPAPLRRIYDRWGFREGGDTGDGTRMPAGPGLAPDAA